MEAGFYPGVMLYMTYWFPAKDRAKVVTLFMLALPLSAVIGAPLSGLILDHVHVLGLQSWRWLFLLEGLPTFFSGIITWFILPNKPSDAKWLDKDEANW